MMGFVLTGGLKMNAGKATILQFKREALKVVASAGRISTTGGSALEVLDKSDGGEKDLRLVGKVLSSGHRSVLEHQTLSIAFDNVSVLVEQFAIEFRLASFTVKSRRYVDFSGAGFVVPEGAPEGFARRMEALFELYGRLLDLGVPREDARFVLPYCFRSNFYMTLNAREFVHFVSAMLYGRGARYPELRALGASLKEQFDCFYPGVIDPSAVSTTAAEPLPTAFSEGSASVGDARLLSKPDCRLLLAEALKFSGRGNKPEFLLTDERPRELELLNFVFNVRNVSLSCVTHFARHRMQSPLFMPTLDALARGNYVLPETIAALPEARAAYEDAFRTQTGFVREMIQRGLRMEDAAYCTLSGHTADLLFGMNARELLHFFKLRTCERAQWEIRAVARQMLAQLRACEGGLFDGYGPSCLVTGRCPEGRLSCGRPRKRGEMEI